MNRHQPGIQPLAVTATIGGAVFILQAIVAVTTVTSDRFADTTADYFGDGLSAAGLFLTLAGLAALFLVHRRNYGRIGTAGIVLGGIGQLGLFVCIVATLAAGKEVLDTPYVAAFVAWLVGLILVAVATARARTLPRWSAVPLPFGAFAATAFWAHGGSILLGIAWIALGPLLLRSEEPVPAASASAVS